MESNNYSEQQLPPMNILREGLIRCCKILGLDQQTCLALTLMLSSSKESIVTMLWAMEQIEEEGLASQLDKDDMTTLIVRIAEDIKEKEIKKQKNVH